jgi:glucose dehydrogenase
MRQTLRRHRLALAVVVAGLGLVAPLIVGAAQTRTSDPAARDWIQLFNGRDLADWTIKFAKHDPGVNLHNTFRESENDDKPQGWGGNDRGGWSEAMLLGLDYQTGKARWRFNWEGSASTRSGLLSTAGNLLFAGDSAGNFVAFDAARGVPLWRAGLHASISNGPVSYQLDGVQYVVVANNDTLYAFSSGARR